MQGFLSWCIAGMLSFRKNTLKNRFLNEWVGEEADRIYLYLFYLPIYLFLCLFDLFLLFLIFYFLFCFRISFFVTFGFYFFRFVLFCFHFALFAFLLFFFIRRQQSLTFLIFLLDLSSSFPVSIFFIIFLSFFIISLNFSLFYFLFSFAFSLCMFFFSLRKYKFIRLCFLSSLVNILPCD